MGTHRHLHHRGGAQNASPERVANRSWRIAALLGLALILSACALRETTTESSTTPTDDTNTTRPSTTMASTTMTSRTTITQPSASGTIRHASGFRLSYPEGWHETGIVISTEFATGAECVAVLIVDQAPPSDPAQAGFVLQSGVQVCAKPVDSTSLDAYMESVYGTGVSEFVRGQRDGVVEYRRSSGLESHIFAQTNSYRFQVTGFVTADPDLEQERLAQVQEILDSLTFG
jgi:hypothetical protein